MLNWQCPLAVYELLDCCSQVFLVYCSCARGTNELSKYDVSGVLWLMAMIWSSFIMTVVGSATARVGIIVAARTRSLRTIT